MPDEGDVEGFEGEARPRQVQKALPARPASRPAVKAAATGQRAEEHVTKPHNRPGGHGQTVTQERARGKLARGKAGESWPYETESSGGPARLGGLPSAVSGADPVR